MRGRSLTACSWRAGAAGGRGRVRSSASPRRRSPTRRCAATPTAVRTLLRDGADVNAAQGDGMTALHWTALNGDLKTHERPALRRRDRRIADARRRATRRSISPARAGMRAVVARLLDAGSKPDVRDGHRCAAASSGGAGRQCRRRQGAARSRRRRQRPGHDARADAARLRGVAEPARGDEACCSRRAPTRSSRRPSSTIGERSAADNQSRQARDRIVSATTGRATNSNLNLNDPPPAGRGRRGSRTRRRWRPRRRPGSG